MAASSLFLFGPVSPRLTQAYLSELRISIVENQDLNFLVEAVEELPSLWPTLQQACPHFSKVSGAEKLGQLSYFLKFGTFPNGKALNQGVDNIMLAPLTVISQVIEFLRLGRETENATFPRLENVQGFCIGFLAAAAVASSQDETEFRKSVPIALRLAVCIGSTVDLDEASFNDPLDHSSSVAVRWTTDLGQANLERALDHYLNVGFFGFVTHSFYYTLIFLLDSFNHIAIDMG